jgi:hypothetical protein
MDTNEREERAEQPQMNQPSREAMAGKLQIYADKINSQKITKDAKVVTLLEYRQAPHESRSKT